MYHTFVDDLLASTSELLDLLVNTSESLLELWVDNHLVEALCEAAEQSRCINYSMCTCIYNIQATTCIIDSLNSLEHCSIVIPGPAVIRNLSILSRIPTV